MEAASIRDIKRELKELDQKEIMALCVRMANSKKENKELLTYLLFEASNEAEFVEHMKEDIAERFEGISGYNYYLTKKAVQKILRNTKKYIRFSKNKETEVKLLLYFCQKLSEIKPSILRYQTLKNIYDRQIALIQRRITVLHEDLQFDYGQELEELEGGR